MTTIPGEMVRAKTVWSPAEVSGKVFYGAEVAADRARWIVTTLEFVQHHLTESGHSDLLVTQTLSQPRNYSTANTAASAARQHGSKGHLV